MYNYLILHLVHLLLKYLTRNIIPLKGLFFPQKLICSYINKHYYDGITHIKF